MTIQKLMLVAMTLVCVAQPSPSIAQDSTNQPPDKTLRKPKPADFNRKIYYRNKLEFSFDVGWLPLNIPTPFDILNGDPFVREDNLNYTLVPLIGSLRWQMDNIRGPLFLRGNTELTTSGSYTAIVRGPETRYGAFLMGLRRNFVQPNWRIVPYLDGHLGLGFCNAKGPDGVVGAQGQDFTFSIMLGAGVRYSFNPRYAIWAGAGYMHMSNLYLSLPKTPNYGINVWGPMFGVDIRLGKPK